MKRGQQIFDSRPEAVRRRKTFSKIEAKLRIRRRGKSENKIEKNLRESPRISRKKNLESSTSFPSSSSDNDDTPRFFTSKQHVELVDFEAKRIINLPRQTKLPQKFAGTEETFRNNCQEKDAAKTRKSFSQTFFNDKEANFIRRTSTIAQLSTSEKSKSNFIDERIDRWNIMGEKKDECNENLRKNSTNPVINQQLTNPLNKKRSRSAPCTPLFKIKSAKDKCPKNFLAERKSLVEKSLREENRKLRINRSKELRISRSGDVAVCSCDTSMEERIIERSNSEAFETQEKSSETVGTTENQQFEEKKKEESIILKSQEPIYEVTIKEIDKEVNLPGEIILTERNSTKDKNFNGNSDIFEINANATIKENEKKNLIPEERVEIVETLSPVVEDDKKEKSPRKPPKKRAFKWETIMEKQHRQSVVLSPENRKKLPEISRERREDDKLNLFTEKPVNCSKYCKCPRSRVKSLENKRLEAYSLIRQELPKILMKRRHAELAMHTEKVIQGTITNNLSPGRLKEIPKSHNSRLNSLLMENIARRYDNSSFENSAQRSSPKSPNNTVNECDFLLKSQFINDSPEKYVKDTKIVPRSMIVDSSQNTEESNGNKCNRAPRASILKNRKTPSPRRVTFSLPGRVMDENLTEDELNFMKNFNENDKSEACTGEINYSELSEGDTEEENNKSCKTEDNVGRENIRRHDVLLETCIAEKAPRFRSEKSSNAPGTEGSKKVQNIRWISPRLFANNEQQNCCESEDSEQDWETPTGEDVHRVSRDISFPKETREAMKILLRAKENALKHHCHKRTTDREAFRQRDLQSRAANSPERNSMLVSKTYAKALAKFQEGCDLNVHEYFFGMPTTSAQFRGSRKTNEAGGK